MSGRNEFFFFFSFDYTHSEVIGIGFGFSAESLGEGVAATDFVDNGGNFKVVTAGTYTLTVANGALKISK